MLDAKTLAENRWNAARSQHLAGGKLTQQMQQFLEDIKEFLQACTYNTTEPSDQELIERYGAARIDRSEYAGEFYSKRYKDAKDMLIARFAALRSGKVETVQKFEQWLQDAAKHDVATMSDWPDDKLAETLEALRPYAPSAFHAALNVAANRLRSHVTAE